VAALFKRHALNLFPERISFISQVSLKQLLCELIGELKLGKLLSQLLHHLDQEVEIIPLFQSSGEVVFLSL
jgi:hypothetical protein